MSYSSALQKLTGQTQSAQTENHSASDLQNDAPRLISNYDGKIVYSNAAFAELCQYDYILEGQYITDLFTFDLSQDFSQNGLYSVQLNNSKKDISLQFNWIDTQSGERFLVASAEEITASEKLLQYVADKIEQKQELKTQAEPDMFAALSFDVHCATETDGKFLTINQHFIDLFGFDNIEIDGKSLLDLIHEDFRAEFRTILQSLREEPEMAGPVLIETRCIGKNTDEIWVQWNCQHNNDAIYFVGHDVSPIKIYQRALKLQQKKLSEAEAIGHIGQWFWKVGAETIEFSDQLYTIFGVEPHKFQPTFDSINKMIHARDAGRMSQIFQRAIIEQNDYEMDFRITRADGEVRYVRCEGRCEIDDEDDVTALYGIMQDVTEATKRELDITIAKDHVERAYAAKTQFLANMSHELRTPLNAIIGFSEMIERQLLGPIGTEKYLEYISGIRESGEHLLDLISDILDMSKIEAGKYELNLERFNIAKVIRMAAHMIEGRALDANIKVKIEIDDEELQVVADRRAVLQMVLNLLSNAVKFSKQDGEVRIKMLKREAHYTIRVEDHGIGIPANKLANITMPFEQAESHYTREYEGSGLGLAITKELAEIHNGSLHIESTLDVGTNVTIRLPYNASRK